MRAKEKKGEEKEERKEKGERKKLGREVCVWGVGCITKRMQGAALVRGVADESTATERSATIRCGGVWLLMCRRNCRSNTKATKTFFRTWVHTLALLM